MRLVVCDDHLLLLEALGLALNASGHEVVALASNPDEAIVAVAEHRPDVCLLDVNFPGGTSVTAIQRIREISPEVPQLLEDVIKKMCAKDATKRHRSPNEAIVALRKSVGLPVDESIIPKEAPVEATTEQNVWPLVAGILAAGVAAWALLWWVMPK